MIPLQHLIDIFVEVLNTTIQSTFCAIQLFSIAWEQRASALLVASAYRIPFSGKRIPIFEAFAVTALPVWKLSRHAFPVIEQVARKASQVRGKGTRSIDRFRSNRKSRWPNDGMRRSVPAW